MRSNLRPAALAAALVLIGAGALAQQPPAEPPLAPPSPRVDAAGAASVLSGRLQQWLLNPNGEVDGFLMADGTQVSFPPHLSANVLQTLKPGDAVQVSGWRAPNVPVLRAASVTATASGRSVVDQPPVLGSMPPPPRDSRAMTAMSASGHVARLLYTDRGDANGVVLDSGTIVRFPPHVGVSVAPALQPGSTLFARGWGSRTEQGSALEATALGASADDMRELFAGPGAEPPPVPRGPGGPGMPRGPRPAPGMGEPLPAPPAS